MIGCGHAVDSRYRLCIPARRRWPSQCLVSSVEGRRRAPGPGVAAEIRRHPTIARRILGVLLGVLGGVLRGGFLGLFLTAFGHRCLVHDRERARRPEPDFAGSRDALSHLGGLTDEGLERSAFDSSMRWAQILHQRRRLCQRVREEREAMRAGTAGRREAMIASMLSVRPSMSASASSRRGAAGEAATEATALGTFSQVDGHGPPLSCLNHIEGTSPAIRQRCADVESAAIGSAPDWTPD